MSEKTQKTSWFKGLSREFKKIIWPDKMTIAKQTAAVVSVSVVLGIIIAIVDFAARYGVDLLVKIELINSPSRKGEDMSEAKWYVVHTYSGYEKQSKGQHR